VLPLAVVDKYKAAALVVANVLKELVKEIKEGASVLELCQKSDSLLEAETGKVYNLKGAHKIQKGIAYPTAISVNSTLCHFNPMPSDPVASKVTLAKDDMVKIVLGAHIDGYASLSGETVVVGADSSTPVTGIKADLLTAAYNAVEAGLRHAKIGGKNVEITDGIAKVLAEYDGKVRGLEGLFSNQHLQNDIQARKTICPFPSNEQRRDSSNSFVLDEGDVYHLDVTVTNSASGSSKTSDYPTSIYSKTGTTKYSLKMKASRTVYSEITNKAGQFPFTLRILEEETKARLGVGECVQHGLLKAYEPLALDKSTDLAAQILVTFALTKTGIVKFSHAPTWYSTEVVKPDAEVIKNEELKALLAKPLKAVKKKTKKPKAENGEASTKEDGETA